MEDTQTKLEAPTFTHSFMVQERSPSMEVFQHTSAVSPFPLLRRWFHSERQQDGQSLHQAGWWNINRWEDTLRKLLCLEGSQLRNWMYPNTRSVKIKGATELLYHVTALPNHILFNEFNANVSEARWGEVDRNNVLNQKNKYAASMSDLTELSTKSA